MAIGDWRRGLLALALVLHARPCGHQQREPRAGLQTVPAPSLSRRSCQLPPTQTPTFCVLAFLTSTFSSLSFCSLLSLVSPALRRLWSLDTCLVLSTRFALLVVSALSNASRQTGTRKREHKGGVRRIASKGGSFGLLVDGGIDHMSSWVSNGFPVVFTFHLFSYISTSALSSRLKGPIRSRKNGAGYGCHQLFI